MNSWNQWYLKFRVAHKYMFLISNRVYELKGEIICWKAHHQNNSLNSSIMNFSWIWAFIFCLTILFNIFSKLTINSRINWVIPWKENPLRHVCVCLLYDNDTSNMIHRQEHHPFSECLRCVFHLKFDTLTITSKWSHFITWLPASHEQINGHTFVTNLFVCFSNAFFKRILSSSELNIFSSKVVSR